MEKSIRVRILNREYPLRVQAKDEALTRKVVTYIDDMMQAFRNAHPDQPELVAAVMAALSVAEELHQLKEANEYLAAQCEEIDAALARVLAGTAQAEGTNGHSAAVD